MESQSRLPSVVRRQVQRAKELERSIRSQAQDEREQEPQTDASQGDTSAAPSGEAQDSAAQDQPRQQQAQQGTDSQQQVKPNGEAKDARENDPAYWKQRFSSTMGILRREREERIAEAKKFAEKISELEAELQKAREAAQGSSVDLSEYLTAEQIEELGEQKAAEMVMLARKVAEDEVKRKVEAALGPIRERQEREQTIRRRELSQKFFDDLTEAVPGWQDINKSEEWLTFLGEVDDRTGMVRQEIIDMAEARYDAKPIVALLNEFMQSNGLSANHTARKSLSPSSTAAAGRSDASDQPDPVRRMTPAEIKRRYTEIAMNRKLSDKERLRMLSELDEAYKRSLA